MDALCGDVMKTNLDEEDGFAASKSEAGSVVGQKSALETPDTVL